MLYKEEISGNYCKWGVLIQQVIEVIQNNCIMLWEIVNYMGIFYCSVNGFIVSLENQECVWVEDYGVKCWYQQFFLMMEEEKSGECCSCKVVIGFMCFFFLVDVIVVCSMLCMVKYVVMQFQLVFGIVMLLLGVWIYEMCVYCVY